MQDLPLDKDQDASDIPGFHLELAERLVRTSPDATGMGPSWKAPQFACHQSEPGRELVCRGWLAKVGHAHPMVRLAVLQGRLSPEVLKPASGWPELHDTYPEVLAKLRQSD